MRDILHFMAEDDQMFKQCTDVLRNAIAYVSDVRCIVMSISCYHFLSNHVVFGVYSTYRELDSIREQELKITYEFASIKIV